MVEIEKDKNFYNFRKMKYKYGNSIFESFLLEYKIKLNKTILLDFDGKNIIYNQDIDFPPFLELTRNYSFVDEIYSTLYIENIYTTKETIRNMLLNKTYKSENQNEIKGIILGLNFIGDIDNNINEENLRKLYDLCINNYSNSTIKLNNDLLYRNDIVYITDGSNIIHTGLPFEKLSTYMNLLFKFIEEFNEIPIIKSVIAHFYFIYIHPYFDGNGRMGRLLQIWILIQSGFSIENCLSFSSLIAEDKKIFYKILEQIEDNYSLYHTLDVTPFILLFKKYILTITKK